jgi:hypothetical protein
MPDDVKSKPLERLVRELQEAHGDNLCSVTLYGSTAHDEADPQAKHDVLVVLRRLELPDLQAALEPIRTWTRAGQPMPVYFSLDELLRAADVFPIEFLQMEQARKTLYGSDPFEFIDISNANLRHQTEYELRTKCLQLRRLYVSAAASAEQLTSLMTRSLSSFAALFRAVLMLHGATAPVSKREAVRATVRVLGLDGAPFDRLFEISEGKDVRLEKQDANNLFGSYLAQLKRVVDAVDQIQQK